MAPFRDKLPLAGLHWAESSYDFSPVEFVDATRHCHKFTEDIVRGVVLKYTAKRL